MKPALKKANKHKPENTSTENKYLSDIMKLFKPMAILGLCTILLLGTTSCYVRVKENQGKHKGWYKNSNNPHHPNTTNPGNSKDKHKK